MLLKSILNRVQFHHGFVFGSIRLVEKAKRLLIEIEIRPRKGRQPLCSSCGNPGPGYDRKLPCQGDTSEGELLAV